MNIMVSNLNKLTTASHLLDLFIPFGLVQSVKIVRKDNDGLSQGVGFIKMDNLSGSSAIRGLNDMRFMNSYIGVYEVSM